MGKRLVEKGSSETIRNELGYQAMGAFSDSTTRLSRPRVPLRLSRYQLSNFAAHTRLACVHANATFQTFFSDTCPISLPSKRYHEAQRGEENLLTLESPVRVVPLFRDIGKPLPGFPLFRSPWLRRTFPRSASLDSEPSSNASESHFLMLQRHFIRCIYALFF